MDLSENPIADMEHAGVSLSFPHGISCCGVIDSRCRKFSCRGDIQFYDVLKSVVP